LFEFWLVLAEGTVRSRTFVLCLSRSLPCCAVRSSWEYWC